MMEKLRSHGHKLVSVEDVTGEVDVAVGGFGAEIDIQGSFCGDEGSGGTSFGHHRPGFGEEVYVEKFGIFHGGGELKIGAAGVWAELSGDGDGIDVDDAVFETGAAQVDFVEGQILGKRGGFWIADDEIVDGGGAVHDDAIGAEIADIDGPFAVECSGDLDQCRRRGQGEMLPRRGCRCGRGRRGWATGR